MKLSKFRVGHVLNIKSFVHVPNEVAVWMFLRLKNESFCNVFFFCKDRIYVSPVENFICLIDITNNYQCFKFTIGTYLRGIEV